MLRSIKSLRGYRIKAVDGEIGEVYEFYFDDLLWTIRYLVADTGNWLLHHRVLVSPQALEQPDWESQTLPVNLTRQQVEDSPPIRVDEPVSRQMETDLHRYYGWVPYWTVGGPSAVPPIPLAEDQQRKIGEDDFHLRSTREVIGYRIQAMDGEIGHVEDFILDDEAWLIRYMVVDTRNWLPGKQVIIDPGWIQEVRWHDQKVFVTLSRETIKNGPEFDPSEPINREYEVRLYDYYGRPKYWL